MKQIKIWDIPDLLKPEYLHLTFDGDKKDLRLHLDEMYRWGARLKRDYNKAAKEIDSINGKGEGWEIYAWYDVSSFEYWMKKMEETNYIQITISFDKEKISENELGKLSAALCIAIAEAEDIERRYSYDPCKYNAPINP